MNGNRLWTAQDVEDILTNPIYAGMRPYPALVPEETWIAGAVRRIQEKGAAYTIGRVLARWQEVYGRRPPAAEGYVAEAESDPAAALHRLLADLRRRVEGA